MRSRPTVPSSGTAATAWRWARIVYDSSISSALRHSDVSQDWTYDVDGLMKKRQMSGNDVPITDEERWFKDGVDVNSFPISDKHL